MPEYLSPGVYIEEIPSGPVPIQGVSTSTTGFVGTTERGPTRPLLVSSWLDFQRWYGGLPNDDQVASLGYLPWAAQGFFSNGGQRAFIARVVDDHQKVALLDSTVAAGWSLDGGPVISAIGPGDFGANVYVRVEKASQNDIPDPAPAQSPGPAVTPPPTGPAAKPRRGNWFALSIVYYRGGLLLKPYKDSADKDVDEANPDLTSNLLKDGYKEPAAREYFDNLSPDPMSANYFIRVINASSKLIHFDEDALKAQGSKYNPTKLSTALVKFFEANDFPKKAVFKRLVAIPAQKPPGLPDLAAYQGTGDESTPPEDRTGLLALKAIREISIICVPDEPIVDGITTSVVEQCELTKSRFGIFQFKKDAGSNIASLVPPMDTTYGAVYYPWINVQNPETQRLVPIPPGGHIAGLYARTDIERGVHKAPANEVLLGPILQNVGRDSPLSPNVTRGQQDILNPKNVNCIRDFRTEGRGVRVWGARTMSSNGQWRYVNVRRLFIFVEQSVDIGTQWVVFEPNDAYTWQRVISSVSGFLNTVWRNGALMGSTREEAFFVRCDRTTMTQDDIDNGRLICLVGIAPVKPAEFVIFRFSQKTADAES